ncbi:signal peptidase II [Gordonia sp. CNJ-863]|uniref:Lipoprotein signal peptidase n=2 Tax=Gordonia rubripertincta TaxID=36822 RepID=A0AAW6RFF3_GORRU|nr:MULTISPECIES: signal peptidase II [Gordonia]MDG6783160.1 signal peptidase II [Gordonia rubripertincta]NKY65430.1 signal peptidase II [Gordonia rubripertincta]OLT44016.1 signal peptidase II [Gordonia sp. CNJ-863]GAB86913.1 lipoprotein signal peptidase [Gordonia rubripertincta NBRC 101908]
MSADNQPAYAQKAATTESTHRRRWLLVVGAAILAAVAIILDHTARSRLTDGRVVDLGPLQLDLAYNTGVAFSLGNQLPATVILALTGAITLGLGVYAWRTAPQQRTAQTISFAAIVAGATANVIDRLLDGKVTDYFHTGWWPTFNLADTYITCGAVVLILTVLFEPAADHRPIDTTS